MSSVPRSTLRCYGTKARLSPGATAPFFTMITNKSTHEGGITSFFAEEIDKIFDRGTSHFDHERFEDTEEKGRENQRVAGLQHESQ